MGDTLKFVLTITLIAAIVFPSIKFLMGRATKAAAAKKTWLAFLFVALQFIIFFAGFTLMMFFALAFISTKTNLI